MTAQPHRTGNSRAARMTTSAVAVAIAAAPLAMLSASAVAAPALAAPGGSVKVQKASGPGVKYTRYSTKSTPSRVTAFYASKLGRSGYRLAGPSTRGSESTVYAKKRKQYAAVQASNASGSTYFEVCTGKNKSLVNKCDSPSKAS